MTFLKTSCRDKGITKWPYRKIFALEKTKCELNEDTIGFTPNAHHELQNMIQEVRQDPEFNIPDLKRWLEKRRRQKAKSDVSNRKREWQSDTRPKPPPPPIYE